MKLVGRPPALALMALLALGGCARLGAGGMAGAEPVAAVAAVPTDPLLIFASRANPGDQDRLVLADGRPAQVRLLRAYNSAGGRECREVLVGAGMGDRTRLICHAANGGWVEARPLLPGGGAARP